MLRFRTSYDEKTELMSRDQLIERFSLDRVGASATGFDYQKLEWMNGVYLRALAPDEYADRLIAYLREQGCDWDEAVIRRAAPLVQEKLPTFGDFPDYAGFFFQEVEPDGAVLDPQVLGAAEEALAGAEPFDASAIEAALRGMAERLGLKPRQAFQPIRVAVTGSTVSPGLFESLEVLGKKRSLERIRAARA